jgi:hypothetical protein
METIKIIYNVVIALGAIGGFIACFPIVRNYFKKADIEAMNLDEEIFISARSGSILFIKIALLAKNSKAIISNIFLKVRHEDGTEKTLTWRYMEEYYGELAQVGYGSIKNTKNQRALALLAYPDFFVEKEFWFYDKLYIQKENELKHKVRKKMIHLKTIGKNTSDIKNEIEYTELVDQSKKSFFWKEGKYNIEVTTTLSNKKVAIKKMEFNLTSVDLALLQTRFEEFCEKRIEQEFIDSAIDLKGLPANTIGITAKIIE